MDPVRFVLDDAEVAVERDPRSATLDALREVCGARACKQGCAPQALCGVCAVLVDGRPRLACTLPLRGVAGRTVRTARSVPNAEVVAHALAACGASACGYCTPGMLVSVAALLSADASPDDAAIQRALALHLCRCTGYGPVLAGVRLAARVLRGEDVLPSVSADALALARGERAFVADLALPAVGASGPTLHGAAVLAPCSGVVRALAHPPPEEGGAEGFVTVTLRGVGAVVAEGDPVLALAHADPLALRARLPGVRVEVAPSAEHYGAWSAGRCDPAGADLDAGVCERWVEGEYAFESTDAAPLEPEAARALPGDGAASVHVHSPGEDAEAEAHALASALGVPVRVTLVPSGGSYGARRAPGVQEAAAALALASGGAVSVVLSHEDSVRLRAKRPAVRVRVRLGIKAAQPAALDVDVEIDGAGQCLWEARFLEEAWAALPPVAVRRLRVRVARTVGGRTAPMRGAVAVPVGVAVTSVLASAGIDSAFGCPDALRAALDAVGVAEGTAHVAHAWAPPSLADAATDVPRVRVSARGDRHEVRTDAPDLGEGHHDALRAGAAEALGVDPARVDVVVEDAFADPPGSAPAQVRPARWPVGGDRLHEAARRAAGGRPGACPAALGALARVELGDEGRVLAVRVVGGGGGNVLAGAAAMGVGRVLVEELPRRADGTLDPRLRGLGVPKLRHALPLHAIALRDVPWGDADSAHVAAASAMAVAIARHEGKPRAAFPARGSAAAAQMGARLRLAAGSGGDARGDGENQHGEPHAAGSVP